jgi:nicotinamide-nucleotide amidase
MLAGEIPVAEALDAAIPHELDALAVDVLRLACEQDVKLVTAESCTGGLLASLLTDIPGQSHAFERGFVTYTNQSKHEMLGVRQAVLDDKGPVSEAVAREMAQGALEHSGGDIALAVTGFADKDPTVDAPGGLVHFALAQRGRPVSHLKMEYGDLGRGPVRIRCLDTALRMIREALVS